MPLNQENKKMAVETMLKHHAEQEYARELSALAKQDKYPKPLNWNLSPWAVVTYIMGGELED